MKPSLAFGDNSTLSNTDDARLSRVEGAMPVSRAGAVTYSSSALSIPASSAVLDNGQISPSTGVSATGNTFSFVVQGKFGFAWAGTILTIYWDGTNGSLPFVIRRADKSTFSVPRGSMSIAALSQNTLYSFAPFISVAQPQAVSFVVGDSGSPRFAMSPTFPATATAQASQTQRLTINERLTDGFISFTTGNSGTTTAGSGTGGGSTLYPGAEQMA